MTEPLLFQDGDFAFEGERGTGRKGAITTLPGSAATHRRTQADAALARWLQCWSRMDGRQRIALDRHRTLICADNGACALLAAEQSLRLRRGRVETCDARERVRFESLLQVEPQASATMCIRRPDDEGHLILQASPLSLPGRPLVIGLAIQNATPGFEPRWADLTELFQLTPAEHRVVKLLLNGMGAEVIARASYLSIDTVRTHIRHAYDKLCVSNREELWRRLAPYRLN